MNIRLAHELIVLALLILAGPTLRAAPASHPLRVDIRPTFDGAPLVFDSFSNTTPAGQRLAVTRLDFLLSNFALRRSDGVWLVHSNWFAYVSGREGRTAFSLSLPSAIYDRMRFNIGVPPQENHADPAGRAPNQPLNPRLNGLHWNWQGGYVFLAIEGNWIKGQQRGYSYHLATDRLLMTSELALTLDLAAPHELQLALNVDRIFSGEHQLLITDDTSSTHSRDDDRLAEQLRGNVERAFAIKRIGVAQPPPATTPALKSVGMAATATPYRLTISRFFPQPALPLDNPLTEEGVELGRRLFHDPRLSSNGRQSCASCHQASAALADSRRFSPGAEGQAGSRNTMPLFNLAWRSSFFWDGRAPTLREQVLQPIQNPLEMHESLANVVMKLEADTSTGLHFARAFGTSAITPERLAQALEQFLLTRVSYRSKFDRSLKREVELSEEEKRGLELFHTEYDPRRGQFGADCFHCHGGPFFQSQSFANNGLDSEFKDPGRFIATGQHGDQGKFAVPSLRNIEVTAPYMHDGRFATLEEVVEHYSTGVKRSATLDPNLAKHPDGGVPLSPEDRAALVAFLKTLTDD